MIKQHYRNGKGLDRDAQEVLGQLQEEGFLSHLTKDGLSVVVSLHANNSGVHPWVVTVNPNLQADFSPGRE